MRSGLNLEMEVDGTSSAAPLLSGITKRWSRLYINQWVWCWRYPYQSQHYPYCFNHQCNGSFLH